MYLQYKKNIKNRLYSILHLLELSRSFRRTVRLSSASYMANQPSSFNSSSILLIYSALAWQILFRPPRVKPSLGARLLAWALNRTCGQRQLGFFTSSMHGYWGRFQTHKIFWIQLYTRRFIIRPTANINYRHIYT